MTDKRTEKHMQNLNPQRLNTGKKYGNKNGINTNNHQIRYHASNTLHSRINDKEMNRKMYLESFFVILKQY